ncbi:hypothetical protein VNO77_46395 [Canavalia gladiata]|uniref:Uncharacterized protein n=1 Tax=Canavalia gladiata TaxID=3824 RepID=A0AAN9PHB3_CANGL
MTERIGYVRENLAPQGQSLSGRDVELFLFLPSLIPTLSALSATLLIPLYLLHYILARIKNLTSSRRVTPPLAADFVCVPCMAPSVRRLAISNRIGNLAKRFWYVRISTSSISLVGRIHPLLETWRSLLYRRMNYVPGVTLSGHSHGSVASRLTLKPFFSRTRPSQTGILMLYRVLLKRGPLHKCRAGKLARQAISDTRYQSEVVLGAMASSKVTGPRPSDDQPKKEVQDLRVPSTIALEEVKAGMARVETSLKEEVEGLKATKEKLRIKLEPVEVGATPIMNRKFAID